jgi:hypothetical protein
MSIAQDNDLFRSTMIRTPNRKVVLTQAVAESPSREEIITAVRNYNSFNESNDPYGEHDFGSFKVGNTKYFFKIDYYDQNWDLGGDPNGVHSKLLTIMEADEY